MNSSFHSHLGRIKGVWFSIVHHYQSKKLPMSVALDSKALDGLRGLASFHVMIFHIFMISESGINIYGQVTFGSFKFVARSNPY